MIYYNRSKVLGWMTVKQTNKETNQSEEACSVLVEGTNCLAVSLWWVDDKEYLTGFFDDTDHLTRFLKDNKPTEDCAVCHVYLKRGNKLTYKLGKLFAQYGVSVTYYDDENYIPNQECRSLSYAEICAQDHK